MRVWYSDPGGENTVWLSAGAQITQSDAKFSTAVLNLEFSTKYLVHHQFELVWTN
jgi:hypothetical protein